MGDATEKTIRLSDMNDDWAGLIMYDPVPRRLHSWRTDPPVRPKGRGDIFKERMEQYRETIFLDALCKDVCDLPTIRGMIKVQPDLQDFDFYAWYPDDSDTLGQYTPSQDAFDISGHVAEEQDFIALQKTTLSHEFRHGYQDLSNCFNFRTDPRIADNYLYSLAFKRVIEADATVLSITVAYEHYLFTGDALPINELRKHRRPSVDAYLKTVARDPEAHWDGRAANAAFKAYLTKKNHNVLDRYDRVLCDDFIEYGAPYKASELQTAEELQAIFEGHLAPVHRLPYIDPDGNLCDRPNYITGISLHPDNLVRNLSADVNYWLMKVRMRDLSHNG